MNSKKTKTKQYVDGNPVEAFRDTFSGVGNAVVDELGKASVNSLWDQLLGRQSSQGGDLMQGQEISLRAHQEAVNRNIEAGYNYKQEILRSSERKTSEDRHEIEGQIEQIMVEISKIMTEATAMKETAKEIRVQKRMVKPGKYHLSFLSFVLSAVRQARKTVENSASWLNAVKSKKKQKSYWAQFKKQGTSFALSNERNVATQVG
jgi:hypothetical protein